MPDSLFRHSALVSAAVAAVGGLMGPPALADETGRTEYMYACSACHGESGLGDGPVARYMNVETPSLTTLAAAHDGVFPLLEVIQVIDGRTGVGPHGTAMPVWGDRFMASAIEDSGRYGAEIIVRGRILSIARYLESIQE
ncbi:c-type cytochrome [Roseicyclus sp.]|uniref:c-type cytochrome n=1 Tax=Roseicyclus sp. TaxID=1914329 RepID=UPI003F9EE487